MGLWGGILEGIRGNELVDGGMIGMNWGGGVGIGVLFLYFGIEG